MASIIEDEDRSYPDTTTAAPNPALYASEDAAANPDAWSPLASSPAALNALARDLGVASRYKFVDVLGLDDELLPAAALAFVAAFPTAAGAALPGAPVDDAKLWFLRQQAGGQCGFLAAAHALANSKASAPSLLAALWRGGDDDKDAAWLADVRSGRLLESKFLRAVHERAAGSYGATLAGIRQGRHFVAFVPRGDGVLLLDGRRPAPVYLDLAGEDFPRSAAAAITLLVAGDADMQLSVLALVDKTAGPDVGDVD